MPGRDTGVFTYNGLDGACAAAAVLLKYPDARLTITSAKKVGKSLEEAFKKHAGALSSIYVCGVGFRGNVKEAIQWAGRLRDRGVEITWFCGRGYLDTYKDRLSEVCRPVFLSQETNTAAICKKLGLTRRKIAGKLCELARMDPNLSTSGSAANPTKKQQFWIDLTEAAISQYFKYQDQQKYKNAIRALSKDAVGEEEHRLVETYRRHGGEHSLRGNSLEMSRLREKIKRVAKADEHVIVTGQSGVGKEYVARLIHEASSRSMGPIVTVNCATFESNESLANSVLFGHVRGAFTGAVQERKGAFIAADGGVLFLDELGDMPPSVQGKFLRVIEDGWVTPVGLDMPVKQADVRVVAATNRNLPRMVKKGEFREDLFHRLDILRLRVPALKDHPEDIGYIAEHLLRVLGSLAPNESLSEKQKAALEAYDWPGNVRQLRKILKRSMLLGASFEEVITEERDFLRPAHENDNLLPTGVGDIKDIREIQQKYAKAAYCINGNRMADTARRLHISANTLKKYLR